MDRYEYLNTVLAQIGSKTVRKEIEKELSAHIDDREQYYLDCGYDSETAAEKAMEHMGSPEAAADGFSKVHKKSRRATVILTVLTLLSSIISFFPFWIILVIFFAEKSALGIGIAEALFLLYIIGLSVIGKRRNSRFICFIAIINFAMTYGLYLLGSLTFDDAIYTFCSHIVFKLACLLTLDFENLAVFWQVDGITVAPYLTYLSIIFYLAILILLILVFISVCMLKKPTYGLRTKQFTKRVFKAQKASCIFIALTMFVLPSFSSFDKDKGMTVKTSENVSHVIIAQSDTPRPISEIPTEDILIISLNHYVGVRVLGLDDDSSNNAEPKNIDITCTVFSDGDIRGKYIEKTCGNKLKYSVVKTDVPCSLTEKYVYIEFFDAYEPEFNSEILTDETAHKFASDKSENWYEAESIGEISAAVDANSQVEIIIEKAE